MGIGTKPALIAAVFLAAACGRSDSSSQHGTGTLITEEQLCQFHYGTATKAQVLAMFGTPHVRGTESCGFALSYRYEWPDLHWQATDFCFDDQDILRDVVIMISDGTYTPAPACLSS